MTAVKVLIVEDSPLFASVIREVVGAAAGIEVVGIAFNGRQAIEMVQQRSPDLIMMDLHMPVMDGLEAIERIMATHPTPILVLTGDARGREGRVALDAIRRGALEVMVKPLAMEDYRQAGAQLASRIRLLASVPVVRHVAGRLRAPAGVGSGVPDAAVLRGRAGITRRSPAPDEAVVGIVASSGGPAALAEILGALPADFGAPILVVQHIAQEFVPALVQWLGRCTPLQVSVARDGEALVAGRVVIAPPDRLTRVVAGRRVRLTGSPATSGEGAGDRLLESIGLSCGRAGVGVVLTGMGCDGAAGLATVKTRGGFCVVQDQSSSAVFGMPRAAAGLAELVLPVSQIASALLRHVRTPS